MPSIARESSVLFSLNELMALEEQRLAEEAAARDAELAAKMAAEQAERLAVEEAAERQRIAAEASAAEARRLEERRDREERARLEAVRTAELIKVQRTVEERARLEALALAQEHERRMATLKVARTARRLKLALWGNVAALVASAAVATFVLRDRAAQHAAEKARWLERLAAEEHSATARSTAKDREVRELRELNESLEARLKQSAEQQGGVVGLHPEADLGASRVVGLPRVPRPEKRSPLVRPLKEAPSKGTRSSCEDAHDPMCGALE